MEIIIPHTRTDFDAFASMLLANKLFPEAIPVLPGNLIYKLREFLSLYRDVADFHNLRYLKKIKKEPIEGVIVVDTKKSGQLKDFESYINNAARLMIFDHHPATADDLPWGALDQFPYGANTTGLFLKVLDRGIRLIPQEATVVMLGIYADTGNLTYPGTTAEDIWAASELLRLEADLQSVNYYLKPFLDPAQRSVFRDMLASFQEIDMQGYNIVQVKKCLDKPMPGLSILLSQVSDMVGADAILGVFSVKERPEVNLIIQSMVPELNAGEITGRFGGGGHPGAAAALLPQAKLEDTADELLTILTDTPWPTLKVRDLMTREVFTIPYNLPLEIVAQRLNENGIQGAPVVNEAGEMVGIISMRDVAKARIQGLLTAPASGFMSRNVLTIEPDAPLIIARKLISSNDIGRIPVIENSRLVGIVSRHDILNALNGNGANLN